MPDIPRYRRQVTVQPVGKAPLPVGAADVAGGAKGAGLGAIGRGISDIGNVLAQIKNEQIALNDAVNSTKANAFISAEEKTFAQYMSENDPGVKGDGSPSDWELEREKSWNELRNNISGLQLSPKARKLMEGKLDAYGELRDTNIRIAQSNLLKEQASAFLPQMLEDAIKTGDPIKIADAMGTFKKNIPTVWGNDKATAEAIYKKALTDGRKEFYIDQSKLFPDAMIAEMEKNKKALGKGGKDEFGLGAKDYDDVIASAYNAKALKKRSLDIEQEKDRDKISKAITANDPDTIGLIEASSIDETEQWTWKQRYHGEQERVAKGLDIITDNTVKTELNNDIFRVLTGDAVKNDIITKAVAARYHPTNPTLSESDYQKFLVSINAQYEEAYKGGMSKVNTDARGILLQPDSLGYVRNAPIRYREFAKFQEEWMEWIRSQGDKLNIAEIYPKGMYYAALHQKSEPEIERLEEELGKELEEKEAEAKTAEQKKVWQDAKKKLDIGKSVTAGFKKVVAEAELKEYLKEKEIPLGDRRVQVEKDGKRFTVPLKQLKEALNQGYKRVK